MNNLDITTDKAGRIVSIMDEDGNVLFSDGQRVDRCEISEDSLKQYINADTAQEERDALFHMLTGYTRQEAENEVSS